MGIGFHQTKISVQLWVDPHRQNEHKVSRIWILIKREYSKVIGIYFCKGHLTNLDVVTNSMLPI